MTDKEYTEAFENREDVRLRIEHDDTSYTDDELFGDTYNPKANPDIPEEQLRRELMEMYKFIDENGLTVAIAEYRCAHCKSWVIATVNHG